MKQVLDHGYLKVIESYGSDERIIEAARMSTNKGFLGWDPGPCPQCAGMGVTHLIAQGSADGRRDAEYPQPCLMCDGKGSHKGDQKLLAYLYSNHHDTPFEMAGLIIEVQAPIMVFREWMRHRTQWYNEMSARYIQMPNLHYLPTVERVIASSKASHNKQEAGGGEELSVDQAEQFRFEISGEQQSIYSNYERYLRMGISKELARINTPVARYSRMRAGANLRNWLAFLTLRHDAKAQWEIQQYAAIVADVIRDKFPRTYELFCERRQEYAAFKEWKGEKSMRERTLEARIADLEQQLAEKAVIQ